MSRDGSAPSILYLSYDGLLEPLGQSQVMTYLLRFARACEVTLLSYEKPQDLRDAAAVRALADRCQDAGIRWIRLRYHKRPTLPATAWDVLAGIVVGWRACRISRAQVVHARGYVPAAIAWTLKRCLGVRFLFDMRGLWADEKVDAGHWRRGSFLYRLAKRWERRFFEQADGIVSLTHAGVESVRSLGYAIPSATPIRVIPTCADLAAFAPGPKLPGLLERLPAGDGPVIGCVGTLSGWYLRTETLAYLAWLARELVGCRILFVTQEPHEALRRDALEAGVPDGRIAICTAPFREMPDYLRLMDLGVFFIKPCFSKTASAATKLAEFLASGVPVVINGGIGDSASIVDGHGAGLVLADVAPAAFAAHRDALQRLLQDPSRRERCREAARRYFDVEQGAARYLELYHQLLAPSGRLPAVRAASQGPAEPELLLEARP